MDSLSSLLKGVRSATILVEGHTDSDGDALTYSISSASNGTLSLNNNIVTYVPNQDWNGEDNKIGK